MRLPGSKKQVPNGPELCPPLIDLQGVIGHKCLILKVGQLRQTSRLYTVQGEFIRSQASASECIYLSIKYKAQTLHTKLAD